MRVPLFFLLRVALVAAVVVVQGLSTRAQAAPPAQPVLLHVDARNVTRGLVTSTETLSVVPGRLQLEFPNWIPAEQGPTGPIARIAMIRMSANGRTIPWSRDDVDMYKFIVDVPDGSKSLDVQFTTIMGSYADANIGIVDWNRHIFYESGADASQYPVEASILLPAGWDFGTSLPVQASNGGRVAFKPVSLAKLIDSPLLCGRFAKHDLIGKIDGGSVFMDFFADNPSDLAMSKSMSDTYGNMVREADAMYGSRHFDVYHALVTLSYRLAEAARLEELVMLARSLRLLPA